LRPRLPNAAAAWVQNNVRAFRYITVGNESSHWHRHATVMINPILRFAAAR
jgi:hypothetical protein